MEICENIPALHIFSNQTELTERTLGIIVILQISQRYFKYSVFQAFGRNLYLKK